MKRYRAIVSIEFTDEDLQEFSDIHGDNDPAEAILAELDGMSFGKAFIEQMYANGEETIELEQSGVMLEIRDHKYYSEEEEEEYASWDRDLDDEY